MRVVYSLLLALVAPFFLVNLYKKKPNKPPFGKRWKEHFGITPKTQTNHPVWIHAVSVGESVVAISLIKQIKQRNPKQAIVVTTTTSTGYEQIAKLGDLVEHRYMPIDFAFAVKGFLRAVQPSKLLIIETELWPNTLSEVAKCNIPTYIVNARLSEKSCKNYQKFPAITRWIKPCITKVLCQNRSDKERFARLGFDESQLALTGSVKFDINIPDDLAQKSANLRQQLGSERFVWVAASTHQGEDEQVLAAHKQLLKLDSKALLILIPRHPERFDDVFKLCQTQGFQTERRTKHSGEWVDSQVYLADTMGEMLLMLGVSDVCFMGGSLVGDKVGGHNLLEPAALGVPSITGPSYFNFLDITEALTKAEATLVCDSPTQLVQMLNELRCDTQRAKTMANAAQQVVRNNQGAIARTLQQTEL